MELIDNYVVNSSTMGLVNVQHEDYNTIIYDEKGIYLSKDHARQLLNRACLQRLVTYEGRLSAIRQILSYYKKTPLLICPEELIYAFPTTSPEEPDCRWIFPPHVQSHKSKNGEFIITFHNGYELPLNCSFAVYNKQLNRANACLAYILNPKRQTN